MAFNNSQPTNGECDCCANVSEHLTARHGMMMCETCAADDAKAAIEASHVVDSLIQTKSDILVAQTMPNVEIRAAIEHNTSIAADMKQFEYTKEIYTRFETLQKALFDKRQEIQSLENQVRESQKEVQIEVGKLRPEHREQFKALDINYQPVKPKKIKPAKTPVTSQNTKAKMDELKAACAKYDVEMSIVKMNMLKNPSMTAEVAARITAERVKAKSITH